MRRRRTVVVVVIVAAVVAASAAAYLTGIIIIGDPLSGVWNTEPAATLSPGGTWRTDGPNPSSGVLIRRTGSGYAFTGVMGTLTSGWHPLERHGRVLEYKAKSWRATFAYHPWSGHLVFDDNQGGIRLHLVLKKVTDSTSIPPQTQ
jgi:hypothetical protein